MSKKVTFVPKPMAKQPGSVDQWVDPGDAKNEGIKKLTVEMSESLHRKVKIGCAQEGIQMAEIIREFLEKRFGDAYATPNEDHESPAPPSNPPA